MNIELAEIQRLITRSQDIESQLVSDFGNMTEELNDIANNVQSSDLVSANGNLIQAIEAASTSVSTNLPEIINFLNSQIVNYERTNTETKEQLDSLTNMIDSTFGSGQ